MLYPNLNKLIFYRNSELLLTGIGLRNIWVNSLIKDIWLNWTTRGINSLGSNESLLNVTMESWSVFTYWVLSHVIESSLIESWADSLRSVWYTEPREELGILTSQWSSSIEPKKNIIINLLIYNKIK